VVKLSTARVSAIIIFLDRAPEISMISLNKLIDGGAAIFAPIRRNQSNVRFGAVVRSPLVRIMLRVWFIS
jgi:hypothetical protein